MKGHAHRTLAFLAALASMGVLPAARAEQAATVHVAACGLEFDLPAGYKVTRPQRSADERNGRACAFDIVKVRAEPAPRGECKDQEQGGQPPYKVCDWRIDAGPPTPSVRVARADSGGTALLESFTRAEDGRWMVPNAHAGDQPAEAGEFCGKPAWRGETIVRMFWLRTRTPSTGIYAGSGSTEVTLVQFAPNLLVQVQNPPIDNTGEFSAFCASLRLGVRAKDLP
ncbi:hypothetical protein PMI14_02377 [Acidovorax sp. CF316]|uniref:hypothetical protein n=1 Tax=Acidovorax sp. CF316 TaxID=1144317 RepID=UPI00026BD752|nr:hypothetical protein [Acidovorax sp. CF316]EJE52898.1 hypothetical protein PMI14_02377 [Acidovorax sp. CF316]